MSDPERASRSLADLMELSPEMRGGAILADGKVLASRGEQEGWRSATADLLSAADSEGGPVEQVHVAAETGEVFAVRDGSLTAVAVTDRFVLASLMSFDLRTCLRDLAAGDAGPPAADAGKA